MTLAINIAKIAANVELLISEKAINQIYHHFRCVVILI